jgi:aminoglycoside phosphotransferase (APT) family kinase protein
VRYWLAGRSIEDVRAALARCLPDPAGRPIVLHDSWVETGNPLWARSSAFIDQQWVVKFAWTEAAAAKLEREIQTLRALATSDRPPPVRRVQAWSSDPVLLVSPLVAGVPLTGAAIGQCSPAQKLRLAHELAEVLAAFHAPETRDAVIRSGVRLPPPTPQANTTELRERLCPMLDLRRREIVGGWCDWTDTVLASTAKSVVLHGDFHGYNIIIDETQTVRVVLDAEEAPYGDYHYDFRYLPPKKRHSGCSSPQSPATNNSPVVAFCSHVSWRGISAPSSAMRSGKPRPTWNFPEAEHSPNGSTNSISI